MSYLFEAAGNSLGKKFVGGKRSENRGWWDEEVKAAIKRRREACRAHRHCKKLAASFPGVISEEQIRKKWEEYLALKRVAKDLVKEKMLKEREDILKEMKQGGGIIVQRSGKGLSLEKGWGLLQLQKEDGGIEEDEAAVAGLAKEYFERLGKGCWDSEESGMDEVRWSPGGMCGKLERRQDHSGNRQ